MLVRLANREDPDQTASSEAVCAVCVGQATCVRNFNTFTLHRFSKFHMFFFF